MTCNMPIQLDNCCTHKLKQVLLALVVEAVGKLSSSIFDKLSRDAGTGKQSDGFTVVAKEHNEFADGIGFCSTGLFTFKK